MRSLGESKILPKLAHFFLQNRKLFFELFNHVLRFSVSECRLSSVRFYTGCGCVTSARSRIRMNSPPMLIIAQRIGNQSPLRV